MNNCKHKWTRFKDEWNVFYCSECKIIGWFKKKLHSKFEIVLYVCQKHNCKDFVTKINDNGERYCDEHYVEKPKQVWANLPGTRRHDPIDTERYYENFTGKKY